MGMKKKDPAEALGLDAPTILRRLSKFVKGGHASRKQICPPGSDWAPESLRTWIE